MNIRKLLLGLAALLTALAGGAGVGMLSSRSNQAERTVMNAVVATTTGAAFNVADSQDLLWTVSVANGVTGTLKFACSGQDTAPDFSGTASTSGRFANVDVSDLENLSSIDGTTGLVFVNSTTVRQLYLDNSAGFKWCTAILSPWVTGTTTVTISASTNE